MSQQQAQDLPAYAQASAGAIGSTVSNTLLYPLDLISTRLQTQSSKGRGKGKSGFASVTDALASIVQHKGVAGLYQGWGADSLSNALSNFLFFYFRSFLISRALARKALSSGAPLGGKSKAPSLTAPEDLACGLLAGIASRFFTTPLSNVTVRLQTAASAKGTEEGEKGKQESKAHDSGSGSESEDEEWHEGPGIVEMLRDIVREKGVSGLWSGFPTAMLLSASPALTFYVSHLLTRALIPRKAREQPSAAQVFVVNALGSSASTMVLYPLILSKSRLMWRSPSGRRQYSSLLDVLRKTLRRSGVAGLYQGWESQILKGLLSHGLTMLVKTRVETLIVALYLAARQKRHAAAAAAGMLK